ncbi:MAG: hypothetical protein AAFO02_20145, partial [Bacteroidota bacterium]
MKPFFICLFLLFTLSSFAQCDAVNSLLRKGDRFLQQSTPNYQEAINAYTAAIIACPERAREGQRRIANMVNGINDLRVQAVEAQAGAASALEQVKLAQEESQQALNKANKLVDAFYFYEDRFALAYGDNRQYYFIDKKGNLVEKLGRWERAEQFDWRGYAKVRKRNDNQDYLLDTLGNTYAVAYNLADLHSVTTCLDLDKQQLAALPDSLWTHTQLQVLLLNENKLTALPDAIASLQQLKDVQLFKNALTSLPESFGQLQQLNALKLSYNALEHLPESFGQLKQLRSLDLAENSLSGLPENFTQLQNLTSLSLFSNSLADLPKDFGQLNKLRTLDLGMNSLS